VALTKKVSERTQKLAIFKELRTNLKAKHEKGVGTLLPRVPPHYTPGHQSDEHSAAISTDAKTLEVTEKHDKHVLQLTASCCLVLPAINFYVNCLVSVMLPVFLQQNTFQ